MCFSQFEAIYYQPIEYPGYEAQNGLKYHHIPVDFQCNETKWSSYNHHDVTILIYFTQYNG